ncbi:MAG: hypothetical protein ACLQUZ_17965 [Rhizomicrobium sp.]
MDTTQPFMFAEDDLPRYEPGADDARVRLENMLDRMRVAANWPWKSSTVSLYRETLWPSLLGKLSDDEAARLRAEIDAEIVRLDAAA